MDRHHKWIAAAAALTSSAWLAVTVIGGPPPSENAPVIQLMAPEFDDIDEADAPKSEASPRGRAAVGVNRPLGLGFPGQVNLPKNDSARRRAHHSNIQPVQGVEPPLPEDGDPPPPRGNAKPLPEKRPSPIQEEAAPEEIPESDSRKESDSKQAPGVPITMRDTQSDLAGVAALSPPYVPANQDPDALPWTATFEDRVARAPEHEEMDTRADDLSELPADYVPWWISQLPTLIKANKTAVPVDVDSLVTGALQYSPQILGFRTQPEIANSVLATENAAFDWTSFVESRWDDLNDPVGNTLTTGNNSTRFIDQIAVNTAGLKRRNEYGGQVDISQKLGWQDNNSSFFVPRPQGTARLMVNYTQPLLNGAGVAYNQSRIVLAQIELNRSFDVVQEELQEHLIRVTEAYWDLYRSRVVFLQRQRVYDRAEYILETLGGRADIDALQRQVNRAKAAVASRRSEIVRSQTAIRNAESRLRLLVNDPKFLDLSSSELVPIEAPHAEHVPLSMTGSLQQALQHRPDISQAVHDLRAAGVRLGVSQNELLPKLDLVLTTYVAGLQGDHDIAQAWVDQFSVARPGYTVGTLYEMPLGNRAAKARLDRRQWELTRSVYDFRTVVETGLTEVELAVRETETSYREMIAKFQSLVAAETESSYLEDRWKVLPGGDRGTTLLLEDLLDSQQRETDAEVEFVNAQVAYSVSLIRVRRAMGTLLISQNPERYPDGSSPTLDSPEQVEPEPAPEPESPTPAEAEPISTAEPESRKKLFRPFSGMTRSASGPSRPTTKPASKQKSGSGQANGKVFKD
ncbi:MAG: TolC family protein [Planctomycetaceae bacterium]